MYRLMEEVRRFLLATCYAALKATYSLKYGGERELDQIMADSSNALLARFDACFPRASKLVCPATLGLAVFHVLQECLSPHFGCPPEHAKRCDGTPSFRCASVGRAAAAPAWAALRLPHHRPTQRLL